VTPAVHLTPVQWCLPERLLTEPGMGYRFQPWKVPR
jgi:hypothetical protein